MKIRERWLEIQQVKNMLETGVSERFQLKQHRLYCPKHATPRVVSLALSLRVLDFSRSLSPSLHSSAVRLSLSLS